MESKEVNKTPQSRERKYSINNKQNQQLLKNKNSVLNQAGVNILLNHNKNQRSKSKNQEDPIEIAKGMIDEDMASRIYKNIYKEDDSVFKKPNLFQPNPSPIQQNLSSQMRNQKFGGIPKQGSNNQLPSGKDSDLLSIMSQRLSKLELLCNSQKQELNEKNLKIIKLEDQLEIYQKSGENSFKQEYEKLKNQNQDLEKKVKEMEEFLKQYGLKWKGYGKNEEKQNQQEVKQLKEQLNALSNPKFKYNLPKEIDINIVLRRIDDLNYLMEKEGVNQVIKDKGIHQFKRMDPFPIGFYQNGIAMKGFKFFPYGSNQASQILADILDGYFPYQLKQEFPNGTLLKIIDKTDQKYSTEKGQQQKFGELNGNNVNDDELKPMSKDEFLNKLPKQVIKNGNLIDIRGEIAKKFDANNDIQSKEKQAEKQMQNQKNNKFQHRMEDDRTFVPLTEEQVKIDGGKLTQIQEDQVCLLKIRTESGKYVILLKLFAEKTIKDVYNITKHFAETDEFSIVDNSTRQRIPMEDNQTLMELDFHPNAVLTLSHNKNQ
ncbi:SEP domain [Pseudocohnilembus persalinus]|uniref:SEP domain n=1 Tax=Pseudocohnilembus persalinus TaxID=266149 RepID=A0A0V0QGW5_PSEPJ|nr:SEP domain [Pseudocohnilembus persalinus]|eukprot:KRX01435.1 SEP domain [Pseudocohnilembus persalinus]